MSLCFPGPKTPGDWKHRDTENTESLCEGCVDKPNTASMTDCSISKSLLDPSSRFPKKLSASVPLCFPGPKTPGDWKHRDTENTESCVKGVLIT